MTRTSRGFAAFAFCLIGCAKSERSSETPSTTVSSTVATVEPAPGSMGGAPISQETTATSTNGPSAAGSPFTCVPRTLRRNDTLTLRMQTPHGDYLTATQPDGSLFFIVYPRFDDPSRKFSLIPSEQFKTTGSLRLPADFRAKQWTYGHDSTEVFFKRPGKYVLWLGENLESDINHHSVKCEVLYQP